MHRLAYPGSFATFSLSAAATAAAAATTTAISGAYFIAVYRVAVRATSFAFAFTTVASRVTDQAADTGT